jgi:hypothetical protein
MAAAAAPFSPPLRRFPSPFLHHSHPQPPHPHTAVDLSPPQQREVPSLGATLSSLFGSLWGRSALTSLDPATANANADASRWQAAAEDMDPSKDDERRRCIFCGKMGRGSTFAHTHTHTHVSAVAGGEVQRSRPWHGRMDAVRAPPHTQLGTSLLAPSAFAAIPAAASTTACRSTNGQWRPQRFLSLLPAAAHCCCCRPG